MTSSTPAFCNEITVIWTCQQDEFVPLAQIPLNAVLRSGVAVVVCTYQRADSLKRFLCSLAEQTLRPDQLIIVDASRDEATELMLRAFSGLVNLASEVIYMRVVGSLRGLTRQRNLGAKFVTVDKLAYFDDDVVLLPTCLEEMARVHQQYGEEAAGVGGYIVNGHRTISLRWRVRRWLRIVPSLEPGCYFRSGMSTPWSFLPPNENVTEGDWLQGCAMMWRTAVVKALGFDENFAKYGNGEDLEFSLRASRAGKLLLAGRARLYHLAEKTGRPEQRELTRTTDINNLIIFESYLHRPTAVDHLYFFYGYFVNSILEQVSLLLARRPLQALNCLRGHGDFLIFLLRRLRGGGSQCVEYVVGLEHTHLT